MDIRTIRRLIEEHEDELRSNDYHVLTGTELDRFRSYAEIQFANDIHVSHKTRNLGVSTVRTLLNFAMLLTNSEIAKIMRKDILDITINTIAEKQVAILNILIRETENILINFILKRQNESNSPML